MTLHITSEPADSLRQNPCRFPDVMTLFSAEQITKELRSLSGQLTPIAETKKQVSDDEGTALICELLWSLGLTSETGNLSEFLDSTTPTERWLIHQRVQQAIAAVEYSARCFDGQSLPTGLLLPVSYRSRIERLIGHVELHVAWVRTLDILKF